MSNLLRRLARHEDGQDVIEYALLAAGISIVVLPIAPDIGATLVGTYNAVLAAVTDLIV
jgi:Flp pilus assembly pilin Flp